MEQASQSTGPLPPLYDNLPKEVRESMPFPPSRSDLWENSPGELVWGHTADPHREALGMTGFSWQVRKLVPGKHFPMEPGLQVPIFEASTPYRACYFRGDSPEEALACLIKGMCDLSRQGAINPRSPHTVGSPPIQHAIHILTERLLLCVEQRRDHLVMGGYATDPTHVGAIRLTAASEASEAKDDEQSKRRREESAAEGLLRATARDNEIVAALATAISALARVKDL